MNVMGKPPPKNLCSALFQHEHLKLENTETPSQTKEYHLLSCENDKT